MLVKYVRDHKKRPVGVVVATDKDRVGWSLCSKHDEWKKEVGKAIAIGRTFEPVPPAKTVVKAVEAMRERAAKYYK